MRITGLVTVIFIAVMTSSASAQCAKIIVEAPHCSGSNPGGNTVYLENEFNDRPVTVTVRYTWQSGINPPSVHDEVKRLAAGQRITIGCTVGGGFPPPTQKYQVVGCTSP